MIMGDRQLIEAIQKIAGTQLSDKVYVVACTVDTVDIPSRTCDCTVISGQGVTEIPNVLLMTEVDDGFFLVPTVGSTVFVVYSTYNEPFVCLFSQVDQIIFKADAIQFNDGSFGGLTKTLELRDQLNKTNQLLTALLNIINGPPIPEPGSSAPSALQAALKAAITGQSLGDYSEIENPIITHGT